MNLPLLYHRYATMNKRQWEELIDDLHTIQPEALEILRMVLTDKDEWQLVKRLDHYQELVLGLESEAGIQEMINFLSEKGLAISDIKKRLAVLKVEKDRIQLAFMNPEEQLYQQVRKMIIAGNKEDEIKTILKEDRAADEDQVATMHKRIKDKSRLLIWFILILLVVYLTIVFAVNFR